MLAADGALGLLLAAAVFGVGYGLLAPTFTYYLGVPLQPEFFVGQPRPVQTPALEEEQQPAAAEHSEQGSLF